MTSPSKEKQSSLQRWRWSQASNTRIWFVFLDVAQMGLKGCLCMNTWKIGAWTSSYMVQLLYLSLCLSFLSSSLFPKDMIMEYNIITLLLKHKKPREISPCMTYFLFSYFLIYFWWRWKDYICTVDCALLLHYIRILLPSTILALFVVSSSCGKVVIAKGAY